MPRFLWIATLAAIVPACSIAQAPASDTPPQSSDQPEQVEVYFGGPGVTLPKLLAPSDATAASGKCHSKQEARVRLSLIVDAQGHPRNMFLDHPVGNDFDKLALMALEKDRFDPGSYQGKPVAVGLNLEMHLSGCSEKSKDAAGNEVTTLRLQSMPDQELKQADGPQQKVMLAPVDSADTGTPHLEHIGHGVTAPHAILQREAEFSDHARANKIEGTCVLSVEVDAHGIPRNIRIVRGIEPSLDRNAYLAVQQYRFRPAMMNGMPVPVMIMIEVRFRLH